MGKWLVVAALGALTAGCKFGAADFACQEDSQCGAGGRCEADYQRCSFADALCQPSGRRFGDLAGGLSGQCVGEPIGGKDAGVDAPADAQLCWGTGAGRICLPAAPTAARTFNTASLIDTGDPFMCDATTSGATDLCVLTATTITINAKVRAAGPKPLVLLATNEIVSSAAGLLDLGSHRVRALGEPEVGAGAMSVCAGGMAPGNSGGGAGGSFIGTGGNGGTPNAGTPAPGIADTATLRGGCPGQDGQGNNKGLKGAGGGAIYLLAGQRISLAGGVLVGGESGSAGTNNSSGGGGGGAGGMIWLDAPSITVTGALIANGGGGGEGSGNTSAGKDGADATTVAAALGGAGDTQNGGDGGNGAALTAAGNGGGGNGGGAGGGGGGGAGRIKAPASANLGTMVSPAAKP